MEFRQTREILRQCRTDAFRLEVRDSYGVPAEQEPLQRFLKNEPFDTRGWFQDWYDFVRELTSRGVAMSRIRVVTVPHTDYQRWVLTVTALNVEAGEDIRYLPRNLAGDIPSDDWWLIDNERVAYTLSDHEGRAIGGVGVTTDPNILSYCRSERERLWSSGEPYSEYAYSR
ncbi:DUF6879 family protein [Nocardia pseudobrasiliensis]|uniref:DUF6879 family protein n=1 Tax=Nocardia pseudobrasiliensis TaxID=45979 RepID=UPI001FE32D5C|nr:DUF6879 family protein [Nocardia pseudobrasiliensis]